MQMETGRPMQGDMRRQLEAFLKQCALDYDEGIDFTVAMVENGEIIATGSLDGCTIKCVAVSPLRQGEDLCAPIITELRREAFDRGAEQLMLFTKPGNQMLFSAFGFYPLVRTSSCLLMENRKNGLADFLSSLERPGKACTKLGCIVANCNPFTYGHRYLIETAAAQVDCLHVFILSEEKSLFPADVRLELARQGCADLKNVFIHPSGPYMVSSATFPSYFIKDKARVGDVYSELDVRLFGEKIAPALGITHRFIGTEPASPTTEAYNQNLKAHLPSYGVEVIELERLERGGMAVSASRVRALIEDGRSAVRQQLPTANILRELETLVPPTSLAYLEKYIENQ